MNRFKNIEVCFTMPGINDRKLPKLNDLKNEKWMGLIARMCGFTCTAVTGHGV